MGQISELRARRYSVTVYYPRFRTKSDRRFCTWMLFSPEELTR